MKIKKNIIQEKLPKPWWKSVLSYVIWYSHTFFPCFGIFEKRLSALWKLCKCAVGIVSGRRALCRAGALGHSQDYSAAMGAFPSLLPRFAKGRGVGSRESWEGTDPVKGRLLPSSLEYIQGWRGMQWEGFIPAAASLWKCIGNATLGYLDKHTLAFSELHGV